MNIKSVHVVGILVILVVGICAISVLFLTQEEKAPVVIYKATLPKFQTAEPSGGLSEAKLKARAEASKEGMLANMRIRGMKDDNPRLQAMERALSSPAYLEYLKEQDAVFPGFNLGLWWDFLESQGISSGRQLQEENFREHFPTGDYADYEPMMRQRLAELFLETVPPEDPTDRREVRRYTLDVMSLFRAEWANKIWMRGYFNGYDGMSPGLTLSVRAQIASWRRCHPKKHMPRTYQRHQQSYLKRAQRMLLTNLKMRGRCNVMKRRCRSKTRRSDHKTSPTSPENSRNA